MPTPLILQHFRAFLVDTWRQTAALWGAQGVSAVSGLAYGKLVALFVAPVVWGEYNLQLATTLLLHSIVVSPMIQTYMSALQQYDSGSVQRFYARLLVWIYGLVLLGACAYSIVYGQWLLSGVVWLAAALQGAYLFQNGYFTAYGQTRRLALIQALMPVGSLVLLGALIVSPYTIKTPLLWVNVVLINGIALSVGLYLKSRHRGKKEQVSAQSVRPMAAYLRTYGFPLCVQAIFGWLTNYGDRYIVGLLMSETAVGYYSVGYGMGARIAMLGAPLLTRMTMRMYADRRTRQPVAHSSALLRKNILLLWLLGGMGILTLWLLLDPIGNLLLSDRYAVAFSIIPLIAVAFLILTTTQLVESAFMAYDKTKYILFNALCTALCNVGANLVLIPLFGIDGAAYAMLISMLLQCLIAGTLYYRLVHSSSTYL